MMYNNRLVTKDIYDKRVNYLGDVNSEIPQTADFGKIKERRGPFGLFKRNVTGEEMNEHLRNLQNEFAEQNRRDILTIEELQRLYNELATLDYDYLKKVIDSAEEMKKIKENVDDSLEKYTYMDKKVNEVLAAQDVLIEKFKAFDNTFILEENYRKLEQEVGVLMEEKNVLINNNKALNSVIDIQNCSISMLNTKIIRLYIIVVGLGGLSIIGFILSIIR